jgi:transcription antitermination factor NusG
LAERWFCARTKNEQLALLNLRHTLPFKVLSPKYIRRVINKRNGYVENRAFPVFRGYVLIRFNPISDPWVSINHTRGVYGLIVADERPVPVYDEAIYELQARCRRSNTDPYGFAEYIEDLPQTMTKMYTTGQRLLIKDGLWQGREGIVKKIWDDRDRIDLLVMLFGKEVPLPVKYDMVEAA